MLRLREGFRYSEVVFGPLEKAPRALGLARTRGPHILSLALRESLSLTLTHTRDVARAGHVRRKRKRRWRRRRTTECDICVCECPARHICQPFGPTRYSTDAAEAGAAGRSSEASPPSSDPLPLSLILHPPYPHLNPDPYEARRARARVHHAGPGRTCARVRGSRPSPTRPPPRAREGVRGSSRLFGFLPRLLFKGTAFPGPFTRPPCPDAPRFAGD